MSDSERAGKQAESGRDASPETAPAAPTESETSAPGPAAAETDGPNAANADPAPGADAADPAPAADAPPAAGPAVPADPADPAPAADGPAAGVGADAEAKAGASEAEPAEPGGPKAEIPAAEIPAAEIPEAGAQAEGDPQAEAGPQTEGDPQTEAGTQTEAGPPPPAGQQSAPADAAPAVPSPPTPAAAGSEEPLAAAVAAMAAAGEAAAPDRLSRRNRRRRVYKRVLIGVTVTVALCLVAGSIAVYAIYRKLDGNITSEDLTAKLGPEQERPQVVAHDATNILLLGSDDRSGDNKQYGDIGEGTKRSDTTILLHLAADRKSSVAVSIPRDLMVDIPSCVRQDGSKSRAYRDQFNHAFEIGGAACTIKTIEQMTKVRVDHHIVIDFSGFKEMVNAVGGVDVCLSQPMRDTAAKLDLPAGRQRLNGEQALGYVRARKNVDDGSDTQRMTRQQRFLAALVKKVKVGDMLTQPWKLYNLLDAGTRSITADPGLSSLRDLMDLSDSIKGIPNDRVAFLTVPRQPYRFDINRDELVQPQADRLFEAIRLDRVAVGAAVSGKDENGFENNGEVRIEQAATPTASTRTRIDENGDRVTVTPTAPGSSGTDKGTGTRSPANTGTPGSSTSTTDPTSTSGGTPSAEPTSAANTGPIVTVSGRTAEQDVCAG
ncbi:LCP family protein [Embleya sp. NPDC008237]|uniref:LCP family protein n=1 Tax=Embleya sp. NPDC008237 TaxID=3363978 RepID=UPI0036E5A650